jgi:lipopolysaccharide transport system ATP-binding protein
MSDVIIRVESLGKQYRLGRRERYHTLRDSLTRMLKAPFRKRRRETAPEATRGRADSADNTFWALSDVSFELKRGEVLGIIGRNGAGKSTLLKVLSSITEPTAGEVSIWGRIGSLLEVGTGFHPELTGRENIFLNGAILGMTRAEIARKFDEIVAFAEVEKFLDTPVKHYSSGMYVRLAFAVAAHLEPEILIVDEVLAVGDAAFQKKCLGKMSEVAHAGRTVLFVSHNMAVMANLCSRGLLLERGRVKADGTIQEALALYGRDFNSSSYEANGSPLVAPRIERVELDTDALQAGHLRVAIHFESPFAFEPILGMVVSTRQGQPLFGTNPMLHADGYQADALASGVATVVIPNLPLYSGHYRLSVFLNDRHGTAYDSQMDALTFEFVSPQALPFGLSADFIGPFQTSASWQLRAATTENQGAG